MSSIDLTKSSEQSLTSSSKFMVWTGEHDLYLCREICLVDPFQHRFGTRERGQSWDNIANDLNDIKEVRFAVTKRGVQERFTLLLENLKNRSHTLREPRVL